MKGVALVVAQSNYDHLTDLANPVNDARAIQKLLTDLGFEVSSVADRDRRRLQRELERFVEDAEDADVAFLYYSGHGIEAAGDNYLVPTDATDNALDAADASLVPLADHLETLQRTVPVTILLLDACRTNPFPPGKLLRTEETDVGRPVTPSGLGAPRSVTPIRAKGPAGEETFGTVIGYAAAPGQVALDGEPGGTSPYAEALGRHLGAMTGEEFGAVLRMVAEEVYLKTAGRQRPWVNESLRRLLYFGAAPDSPGGAEGDILRERRQLLLTIARLGTATRQQIETIASTGNVPMDAIYGLLRTLGAEAPEDPAELDKMLRGQTERLKSILTERAQVSATDPEVARLGKLASDAVAEGAIETALQLHEDIKRRVATLSQSLDQMQANIDARRREFAAAYASSARTYALAFEYVQAAGDLNAAFEQVRGVDRELAWMYRNDEGLQHHNHGVAKGDTVSLARAIDVLRDALTYSPRAQAPYSWARTTNNIGIALVDLGLQLGEIAMIETAVALHRDALDIYSRDFHADQWAWTQMSIGNALLTLSERNGDAAHFEQAVVAYRLALEVRTREASPVGWARIEQNLGTALTGLAGRNGDVSIADESIASYRRALTVYTRDAIPLEWANTTTNLAAALRLRASLASDSGALDEAIGAYRSVLEVRSRESMPLGWATTKNNLGNALIDRARLDGNASLAREAVSTFRDALLEQTVEHAPVAWARSHRNLGRALDYLYDLEKAPSLLDDAVAEMRLALTGATRERGVTDWASTMLDLGYVLERKADVTDDRALYAEARSALRTAMNALSPINAPAQWSETRQRFALLTYKLGWKTGDLAMLREAADLHRERLAFRERTRSVFDDGETNFNLGIAMIETAKLTGDPDDYRAAVTALRAALPAYGGEKHAASRARTSALLGDQLLELAIASNEASVAREAVDAYSAALSIPGVGKDAFEPSFVRHQSARARMFLGESIGDRTALLAAHDGFLRAAEDFRHEGKERDSAIALTNAGVAIMMAGWFGQGVDDVRRAQPLLRLALERLATVGTPLDRAETLFKLARTAELIGERSPADGLGEAVRLYGEAVAAWPAGENGELLASANISLGQVLLRSVQGRSDATAEAEQAQRAYRAAGDFLGTTGAPVALAMVHNGIAYSQVLIADARRGGADAYEGAVASARLALDAQLRSGVMDNLPAIRDTLCRALIGVGQARKDRAVISEAISTCEIAAAEFTGAGDQLGLAETSGNLARARSALAALE